MALEFPKSPWMNEELLLLEDACRQFYERECVPHYEEWEARGDVGRKIWEKAGQMGLLGAEVPEAYGGPGGSFAHDAVIAYQGNLAGIDGWGGGLHNSIVIPYIIDYGSEEQKQNLLPKLVSGELIGAIAMTEPGAGSDLQAIKTSAIKDGNHYRISGSKTFITNGALANLVIVVAKTDPKTGGRGISLFLVETDTVEGFRRGRNLDKLGMKSNDTSEMFFDDMRVPASALLGSEEGQGFVQMMQQLPQERLLIGVYAVARMERALRLTLDYVSERSAFGRKISEFQNTEFVLAECASEATVAKVFLDHCISEHLEGRLSTEKASMAKYWLTDLQARIIDRCLQLFGGYGVMSEYPIERMYRDNRIERIYAGTNEIMKVVIARGLFRD
ncbi:acyl-CoA dehydrogenase/long-chain-acyl-CoA dehydrogenase [Labrenzia sp. EL_208]|uniref:Acyl-[acyl-carrier-protein] dehydrogenase MbtN n=1 Tax=Roseibium album TaxID=311410 RepID=A0A0M6ZXN8_9HYPH|nr:acyl-CoA dehydrogenase family protein [Roseibium album]MBG6165456.1 acyl-CoA dehydrogenase/long-chain-acyl-CoA dehydrogenase [Labrenzia sp. EL_195]MBG6177684.1 acyl-CoA dehydrogenase/long-chain-acyl-CoA dehydrogenase [Labrenzia sp. EL_132]MBG6232236.1 acyl-CoA dehydrogenase/long-chain-acyl-CoA dehydrogenase [Labrenzia sp. EL_208]CTQ58021.1 Acyl-CoA dehydrogenase [Roseibium album]CTQ67525.1 Acyl-CoA dehydrogenase [Roseibium album]